MIRILVVDDHDIVRDSLCQILSSQNDIFVVGSAENGEIALNLLDSGLNVNVLLTDLNMPLMDGLELTRKAIACNNNLHVIILSMSTGQTMLNTALQAGAKAVFSKDSDLKNLLDLIRKL
jgi:DNA-binding NarL/FixJ family response regulator